jgi:hypothetical protein
MFNVKNEPQTAEQVLARARHTYGRITAQRKIIPAERPAAVEEQPTEQALAAQPTTPIKYKPMPSPLPLNLTALERIVIRIVAQEYELDPKAILSRDRVQSVVGPRQIAMWIVKRLSPTRSLPRIGKSFGGRDHTTVLHALRTVDDKLSREKLRSDLLEELVQKCGKEAAGRYAPIQHNETGV